MGCTHNFEKIKEDKDKDKTLKQRSTIEIEYLNPPTLKPNQTQKTQAPQQQNSDGLDSALKAAQNNENIIEKEKKIKVLIL